MPVKNRLKDVLYERLGEQITAYKFSKLTGLAAHTSLRMLNNSDSYPDKKTTEAICKAFGLQPGDFIYFTQDVEESWMLLEPIYSHDFQPESWLYNKQKFAAWRRARIFDYELNLTVDHDGQVNFEVDGDSQRNDSIL